MEIIKKLEVKSYTTQDGKKIERKYLNLYVKDERFKRLIPIKAVYIRETWKLHRIAEYEA